MVLHIYAYMQPPTPLLSINLQYSGTTTAIQLYSCIDVAVQLYSYSCPAVAVQLQLHSCSCTLVQPQLYSCTAVAVSVPLYSCSCTAVQLQLYLPPPVQSKQGSIETLAIGAQN